MLESPSIGLDKADTNGRFRNFATRGGPSVAAFLICEADSTMVLFFSLAQHVSDRTEVFRWTQTLAGHSQ